MIGNRPNWSSGIVAFLMMLLLISCAHSPRVDFYVLSADASAGATDSCGSQAISVGPVSWPRYLDQPRIVTRTGSNTLDADEFNRWGGSLEDDFVRTVIKNISNLLRSEHVVSYRRSGHFAPVYRVAINVHQFDGQLGGNVTLDVKWSIITASSGELAMVKTSAIQKSTSGPDYEAMVNASSMAVAQLSEEIAAQLSRLCAAGS